MINIDTSTKEELLKEYDEMQYLWGMYSCDCFGFYIQALHRKIVELGGWPTRTN